MSFLLSSTPSIVFLLAYSLTVSSQVNFKGCCYNGEPEAVNRKWENERWELNLTSWQ